MKLMFWALLAGLVVATLATWWRVNETTRLALLNSPPEGDILTVDGVPVHAVVRGTGPDLVMIHGAGGNTREFTFALMDQLADRYRVIAFDRPGHGYTGRIAGFDSWLSTRGESPREQARFLQAAAAQLGVTRPIILGQSFGTAIALAWALEAPDQTAAVVNVAGVSHPWPGELSQYYRNQNNALGAAHLPPLIAAWAGQDRVVATINNTFLPQPPAPGYADHLGPQLSSRASQLRASTQQINSLYPFVEEMAPLYPTLTLPIEIVHGTADLTVPINVHSRPLAAAAPHARLTELPGVGHMPQHTNPDAVIAAIDRAAAAAGLR